MSESIPSKIITVRPNDKPWFDSELRRFIKYRDRQRKTALHKCTPSSWEKYKRLRNKVNNLKKFARKHFFENIEFNIESDSLNNKRGYWNSLKGIINNYKDPESIPILSQVVDGIEELYYSNDEKANCLNNFFTSV